MSRIAKSYNELMQPSIFGKSLDDVTYDDVVAFCGASIKEGLGLDYKKDLSSIVNVVKTMVSFANTNGGWVLVGIEDDGHDLPKLPATGMTAMTDSIQKLNNSLISTVTPVFLPFYKECLSADGKKMFLVIHVPQSDAAPHFMHYKDKNVLFIRVADRAKGQEWEDYATSSQWEMLRNRREASSQLGKDMMSLMRQVFVSRAYNDEDERHMKELLKPKGLMELAVPALSPVPYTSDKHFRFCQTIRLSPLYPSTPWTTVNEINHMLRNEQIINGINFRRPTTPDHRGHDTKIYQTGAYTFHLDEATNKHYFFGFDVHGNIMNVDPIELSRRVTDDDGDKRTEYFTEIRLTVMSLVGVLAFASKAYQKIGLLGNLRLRVEFDGSDNCQFLFDSVGWPYNTNNMPTNPTGTYAVERYLTTDTLAKEGGLKELVHGIIQEELYSFNYGFDVNDKLDAIIDRAMPVQL